MEEKMLKIIDKHIRIDGDDITVNHISLAKEIADHFKKFIEWIGENCTRIEFTKEWIYYYSPMEDKFYNSTEEIYQYYCDNELNQK